VTGSPGYVWGRRHGANAIFYAFAGGNVRFLLPTEVADGYGSHVVGKNRKDGYNVVLTLVDDDAGGGRHRPRQAGV